MANTLTKLMLALSATTLTFGATAAYAKSGDHAQRVEKRIERALKDTDATEAQKKKVTEIIKAAFEELKPVRAKAKESMAALKEAMQAPTIDKARIEQIRAEQMKAADESSRRMTKAMTDAGDVLSQSQRQAFFKKWDAHFGKRRG